MNSVITILILSLLPFKNTYLGFRISSLSHVPGSFVMQIPVGSTRLGFDMGISYSTLNSKTQISNTSPSPTQHFRSLTADVGVEIFVPVVSREYNGRNLLGFMEIRSGYSFGNEVAPPFVYGQDSVKTAYQAFSVALKVGSEYSVKIFGMDTRLQLSTDLVTLTYKHNKRTIYNSSGSSVDEQSFFNVSGMNLFAGKFSLWLLFKL